MSVNNQNATPIRRSMNGMFLNRDVAVIAVKTADELVVVARDVDDPGAFARFPQNFLDDVVVLLRPVKAAAHLPDIDQIAHDIERLEIVVAQKIEQARCPAAASTQMDIGNPSGPHPD